MAVLISSTVKILVVFLSYFLVHLIKLVLSASLYVSFYDRVIGFALFISNYDEQLTGHRISCRTTTLVLLILNILIYFMENLRLYIATS